MSVSLPPVRSRAPLTHSAPMTFAGRRSASLPPATTRDAFWSNPAGEEADTVAMRQVFQALENRHSAQLNAALKALQDKSLLGSALDPYTGNTALITAAQSGNLEGVRQLLAAGAPVYSYSAEGEPLVHVAAVHGQNLALMQALQKAGQRAGLDVSNMRDQQQRNALHALALNPAATENAKATQEARQHMVNWLVAQGVDLNAQDSQGLTPYLNAVGSGNVRMMKVLQAAGANLQAQAASGMSSLHWAAGLNQAGAIKHLLSPKNQEAQQLDPNVPMANGGITPLHLAVAYRNREAIEALLARGADWEVKNQAGDSPWLWAQENGPEFLQSLAGLPLPAPSKALAPKLPVIHEVPRAEDQAPSADTANASIADPETAASSPPIQPDKLDRTPTRGRTQKPRKPLQKASAHSVQKSQKQPISGMLPTSSSPPADASTNPFALLEAKPLWPTGPVDRAAPLTPSDAAPEPSSNKQDPKAETPSLDPSVKAAGKKNKKKASGQAASSSSPLVSVKTSQKGAKTKQPQSPALDELDQALLDLDGRTTSTPLQTFDQLMLEHHGALKLLPPAQQLALISRHLNRQNVNAPYFITNPTWNADPPSTQNEPQFLEVAPLHSAMLTPIPLAWVNHFMTLGANPYARDNKGRTPFHYAALLENVDYLEALSAGKPTIRKGHDISPLQDSKGETPLHYAAQRGRLQHAQWLLEHGVPVNAKNHKQESALHQVAQTEYTELAPLLLNKGADPKAANSEGFTAVHLAVRFMQLEMLKTLLGFGCFEVNATNRKGSTALHEAMATHDLNSALQLIKNGAEVDKPNHTGTTPVHLALHQQNPLMAQKLLELGAKPDTANHLGVTPMHLAAALHVPEGCFNILSILLAQGAKVDPLRKDDGSTPLMQAVHSRNKMAISLLLANGADLTLKNKTGENILHQLLRQEHFTPEAFSILDLLLSQPPEIKEKLLNAALPPNQFTPLHVACATGKVDAMRLLLRHGADPTLTVSHKGENILHQMMLSEQFDEKALAMLNLILEQPPETVAKLLKTRSWDFQNTPLHLACAVGNSQAVQSLLHHGADPRTVNCAGKNALHIAVDNLFEAKIPEMVTNLLEQPHLVVYDLLSAKTEDGFTPLDLALCSPNPMVSGMIAPILKDRLAAMEPLYPRLASGIRLC